MINITNSVLEKIKSEKVVAILRGYSYEDNFFIMDSLLEAGISIFEVSLNTEGAIDIIRDAVKKYSNEALVGAGTVMTESQVDEVINAEAKFIFAPNLNEKVVNHAVSNNILFVPGVYTPSEIYRGKDLGCPLVKLFPATSLGSNYIKQVLSPLEGISIMAVGGIDENNMYEYLNAGAAAVGIGSSMTPKELILRRDKDALIKHIQKFLVK